MPHSPTLASAAVWLIMVIKIWSLHAGIASHWKASCRCYKNNPQQCRDRTCVSQQGSVQSASHSTDATAKEIFPTYHYWQATSTADVLVKEILWGQMAHTSIWEITGMWQAAVNLMSNLFQESAGDESLTKPCDTSAICWPYWSIKRSCLFLQT